MMQILQKLSELYGNPSKTERLYVVSFLSILVNHFLMSSNSGGDGFASVGVAICGLFIFGWAITRGEISLDMVVRSFGVMVSSVALHRLVYSPIHNLNELGDSHPFVKTLYVLILAVWFYKSLTGFGFAKFFEEETQTFDPQEGITGVETTPEETNEMIVEKTAEATVEPTEPITKSSTEPTTETIAKPDVDTTQELKVESPDEQQSAPQPEQVEEDPFPEEKITSDESSKEKLEKWSTRFDPEEKEIEQEATEAHNLEPHQDIPPQQEYEVKKPIMSIARRFK